MSRKIWQFSVNQGRMATYSAHLRSMRRIFFNPQLPSKGPSIRESIQRKGKPGRAVSVLESVVSTGKYQMHSE